MTIASESPKEPVPWWNPHDECMDAIHDAASEAVEAEVYRAVRTFLTSDDPDTLLDWLAVPAGPGIDESDAYAASEALAVRLVIEGRGDWPEIRRDFVLRRMVQEEVESRMGQDGSIAVGDRAYLVAVAEELERLGATIREALK